MNFVDSRRHKHAVEASITGWIDGFTDTEMKPCHVQPYYRSLPAGSIRGTYYRFWFNRSRRKLEKRISEGGAQIPGSVYDPNLDDGRGA